MTPEGVKVQRWPGALQQHDAGSHSHSQHLPGLGGVACATFAGRSSNQSQDWAAERLASAAQVKKAGALDGSSVDEDAEMESVRRLRKPLWIGAGVIIFQGYIIWPILMLPAKDWGSVTDTTLCPCTTLLMGLVCH